MTGNTPYAGQPTDTDPGRRANADVPELSPEQRRTLQAGLDTVVARTREYLPDEYVVGAQIVAGSDGPEGTVAVQPPIGHPVSAGLPADGDLDEGLDDDDRDEVARGLAASAALQVKQAVSDAIVPVAR
ncbi:DUF5811 family protein [Halococcus sp. IIIV-5B]|uniref:DUF5811 family protein n=1 Tax=Halococcus sp. IIIV-5B TaxID=2321230 RepID=UPI000E70F778|nr:DUF5811 family protein [Halococcus sp. IIIV-5B]RJT00372.1 hypothetical protein D3261_15270 [Halococcus sp. IIIV-5B]